MLLYPSAIIISLITSSVFAQSTSSGQSISAQCQSSLTAIVASPDAQCLNVGGFVPIFLGSSSASAVGSINTWLTGLCSENACSNQSLSAFVTNITQGCSSDFPSLGLNNQDLPNVISTVQELYPTVRQVSCLKDDNASQLCVVEELYSIQNQTGTINANNVPNIITGGIPSLQNNTTCNSCNKEAYNIVIENVPQLITSSDKSNISNQCGASFIDGKTPAGISQTAVGNSLPNTNMNSKSGALRLALWDGLTVLSGLGTFLAVLL